MAVRERKILIRGVNWIGDAVMTLPAIRAVRRAYPKAYIAVLAKPSVAPVYEHLPGIDEVILQYDYHEGLWGRIKMAMELRKKHFSTAILLQNAFGAALTAFLAGIPERIGYDRDGRGFLLTKAIPYHNEDMAMHHIKYYLHLLNRAGMPAEYERPALVITLQEHLKARKRLAGPPRPLLGLNPGATYGSAKRWYPDRFAEVGNWFIRTTGGSVVIFGSKTEEDIALEIDEDIPDHKLCVAGHTTIRDLMALLAECDALVTNDSGPMHLANAIGTPLVAIFGSTQPALTGPLGDGVRVLDADVSCSPCFERTCPQKDLKCMTTVTADEVSHELAQITPRQRAVFFDRDGTLCRDANYLSNWKDFEVFPDIDALKRLKAAGYLLIGISNQSGIGRGLVDEQFAKDVNHVFIDKYEFDDFFYCPHRPDDNCSCRKPQPRMIQDARLKHRIDLSRSWVVGDKDADMLLAEMVGAHALLVQTGQQQSSEHADMVVQSLSEAVAAILANGQKTS
ncbi:MAG TPA: lipopolysaccharide heptosyltransferase II [Dissulfurispiraceae bacterium]|nr:lipopolysaccharide heptosyltransferase II [Dissulfurispiraceae bacterium]